ncbi:MAG: helix-turn-helix transcriptional regulator [Firmicutes bacterium]|nr:helix-turn-helix transcriptional regulator [Bacillota bacterium]
MDYCVGIRLRQIREDLNLSGKAVAEAVGIKADTYRNYENGRRIPNAEVLRDLCLFLDVTPEYILGFIDTPYTVRDHGTVERDMEFERAYTAFEIVNEYFRKQRHK